MTILVGYRDLLVAIFMLEGNSILTKHIIQRTLRKHIIQIQTC